MNFVHSDHSIFYVARLVLQTLTPLSISEGHSNGVFDNLIVRDANGLPAIPGTSLAGILRHLHRRIHDDENATRALFGVPKPGQDDTEARDQPSMVAVSWGCIHDSNDCPVEGLREPDDLANTEDSLLRDALQTAPVRRDHVRINGRGVSSAADQAKFDRTSLTTGHRFSVELSLWSDRLNDPRWQQVLDLLRHPQFRIGGATRRGLGKIKVKRCAIGCFPLGTEDAQNGGKNLQRFSRLTPSLGSTDNMIGQGILEDRTRQMQPLPAREWIELNLKPLKEGYRFGGLGEPWDANHSRSHLTPAIERQVVWNNGTGRLDLSRKQILIPASGVKGALSHRAAYHYNLLTGNCAERRENETDGEYQTRCLNAWQHNEAVRELFGYVDDAQPEEQEEKAKPGSLIFDDLYIRENIEAIELPHSGIDRFTGGVRDGVLFFEELVTHAPPLPDMQITLTRPKTEFPTPVLTALERALHDLTEGRLALGAGGGRGGYGYFEGKWTWHTDSKREKEHGNET